MFLKKNYKKDKIAQIFQIIKVTGTLEISIKKPEILNKIA